MRICINSSAMIPGLRAGDSPATRRLNLIGPELILLIPRLVALEVTRNLRSIEQVRRFYHLFQTYDFAFMIDEPVPPDLVEKYVGLGLPEKADAFIGAFAEWLDVAYLISENRHFLRELQTDAFQVITPAEFMDRGESGTG